MTATRIPPVGAWVLRRLLSNMPVNGEMQALPEPFRPVAEVLADLKPKDRDAAWRGFLAGRPERDGLVEALAAVDPQGPAPEAPDKERRAAHLGDLSEANNDGRFCWPRWIVRAHFTLLTSEPKVGKTRLGMDLARRLWHGLPWPDGQPATLPPGTKTLWVPGDRQQDELRELAPAFGLPFEAVLLNASPDAPYGGVSLDDRDNVEALRERVEAERPGLVFIDTVWRATRRKLCREDEVNILMDPILQIAQECDVPIVGMMHASKDGETLGRRLEGLARAVIKLSKPDPDGKPDRRKFWVDRANFKEGPALGVTMEDGGCVFDFDPPDEVARQGPGRPRGAAPNLEKAVAFLTERLSRGDEKQCVLVSAWEGLGESKGTVFNAFRAMQDEGRLVIDESRKPKICRLVKQSPGGQETVF